MRSLVVIVITLSTSGIASKALLTSQRVFNVSVLYTDLLVFPKATNIISVEPNSSFIVFHVSTDSISWGNIFIKSSSSTNQRNPIVKISIDKILIIITRLG